MSGLPLHRKKSYCWSKGYKVVVNPLDSRGTKIELQVTGPGRRRTLKDSVYPQTKKGWSKINARIDETYEDLYEHLKSKEK